MTRDYRVFRDGDAEQILLFIGSQQKSASAACTVPVAVGTSD